MKTAIAGLCLWLAAAMGAVAQTTPAAPPAFSPATHEASFKDFRFRSGESLPSLRIRYETLGAPHKNTKGEIDNAVLLLHGTGGDGLSFMRPRFSGGMFGPGQPLDIAKFYIVMIDSIGHGGSSKPSDGLRARFPHYDYGDMVEAEHRVTTEVLGIKRLRLLFGTSMGCMHAFLWAETWPDAASAIMPMACLPVEIAGRNRVWRKMSIEAIKRDPDYKNGDYDREHPPLAGLRTAADINFIAGSAPHQDQKTWPTRDAADAFVEAREKALASAPDANDQIYFLDSSRTYNPEPDLGKITAPVLWINSDDDFINPPELGIAERLAPKIRNGRFVRLPISPKTRGHGTHSVAEAWSDLMVDFLKATAP